MSNMLSYKTKRSYKEFENLFKDMQSKYKNHFNENIFLENFSELNDN